MPTLLSFRQLFRPALCVAFLLAGACGKAQVNGAGAGGSGGAGAAGGATGGSAGSSAGGGLDGPSFGVMPVDSGPAPDVGTGAVGPVCGETSLKAQRTPLDLLLLIDASDSMAAAGAGTMASKYTLVRQ